MASEEKIRQNLVNAVGKADNAISGSLEIQINELINDKFLTALQNDREQLEITTNALSRIFHDVGGFFREGHFKNKYKEDLKKELINAISNKYGDQPNALELFFDDIRDSSMQLSENNPFITCKIPARGSLSQVGIDKIQQTFNKLDEAVTAVLNHHGVSKLNEVDNEHTKGMVYSNIVNSISNALMLEHYDIVFSSKSFAAISDMNPFKSIAPIMLNKIAYGRGDEVIELLQNKNFIKIIEDLDVRNIYPVAHFISRIPSIKGYSGDECTFRFTNTGFTDEQEDIILKQLLGNDKIRTTLSEWTEKGYLYLKPIAPDEEYDDEHYYTSRKIKTILENFEAQHQITNKPSNKIENKVRYRVLSPDSQLSLHYKKP